MVVMWSVLSAQITERVQILNISRVVREYREQRIRSEGERYSDRQVKSSQTYLVTNDPSSLFGPVSKTESFFLMQ